MAELLTNRSVARIDVLICTFRRPSIESALASIDRQRLGDGIVSRVIVADNDETPSAQARVAAAAAGMKTPVTYLHAPARNISIARNACLDAADGDWVAFMDDDEVAHPDWLASLYGFAIKGGYDAVFGPAVADYAETAPAWIRAFDYHSNRPVRRFGEVQTGHTCNALLLWRGGPFTTERFLLEKGKSGGEDTEYFFRLRRAGARFGICENAEVFEPVDPARLTFDWIRKRKFRAGQSYGRHSHAAPLASAGLAASSLFKIASCGAMAGFNAFSTAKQRYWALRGVFHYGVFAAQFGRKEDALYGE
ncbi:MAG: glycosyltransferase family 2 protein [Amphiplicatus sp.]